MSSLAAQLANVASGKNAAVLDKKKRKKLHSVSLIWEPKEAAGQDFETIYYEAFDALQELEILEPRFKAFENSIFSKTSIGIDREVQTQDQNDLLDKAISNFFSLVAPRINLQPALLALEWLVRRFQIHHHNGEELITTVLPYYSSPVFVRVLDIIPTPLPKAYSWLEPGKKAAQNPSRNLMIRALTNDSGLFSFVTSHVISIVNNQRDYHGLLAFWSSLSIWTMVTMKEQKKSADDIVERYLPAISQLIQAKKRPDAQITAYMVLVVLSAQLQLNYDVKVASILSISRHWSKNSQNSGLACVTQLVKGDENAVEFVDAVLKAVESIENLESEIVSLAAKYDIQRFVAVWALGIFKSGGSVKLVHNILQKVKLSDFELGTVMKGAIEWAVSGTTDAEQKAALAELFEVHSDNHNDIFAKSLARATISLEKLELSLQSSLRKAEAVQTSEDSSVILENNGSAEELADIPKLDQDNFDSYLDIAADISKRVEIMVGAVSQGKKVSVDQLSLKSGSEASFLARVWIGPYPLLVRAMALNLFIDLISGEKNTDFQTLLPTLLLGLADGSERIRRLSGTAITALAKHYPAKKPQIWGMNTVYGTKDSENVVVMSTQQVSALLSAVLVPKVKECAMDGSYIEKVVQDAYSRDKKFVQEFWDYIHGHVLGANIPQLKAQLLTFADREGKNDVKAFAPLLGSWIESREMWKQRCTEEKFSFSDLESQVVALVTNGDKDSLKFLESSIKSDTNLANIAGEQIVSNWHRMRGDSQNAIVKFLVDHSTDENATYDSLQVLNNVKISNTQFVSLLSECQLDAMRSDASSPASVPKRRRRSSAATKQLQPGGTLAVVAERHLRKLSTVLELLESNHPDASVELLAQLFSILRDILSIGSDMQLPVDYVQQVLGNCMIMVVRDLKEARRKSSDKYDSNAIRVDIVVQCIRTSASPQVQNRFLALVGELASLEREIVLHGVMPIFTFMGANTVRKDDEYSAKIIQNTLEQVIPALFSDESDRQEDMDSILNSFATALMHVPRHRRAKMYSTLISTLGVETSFYRFLVFIGTKYYELINSRHQKEAEALVDFGKSLSRSFSPAEKLRALKMYLKVVAIVPTTEVTETSEFARSPLFKNAMKYTAHNLKELKSELYEFAGALIGTRDDSESNSEVQDECAEIIELLLAARLATTAGAEEIVSNAVFEVLERVMAILPITDLVQVVSQLLQGETEITVKVHGLALLRSRFEEEHVDDRIAQDAARVAIAKCKAYLQSDIDNTLLSSCLDTLDVIVSRFGSSQTPEELLQLCTIAVSDKCLRSDIDEVYITSVALVSSLCTVLGARIIGHFGKILPVAISRFEKAIAADDDESEEAVQLATLALFAGMVKRIPAFVSSNLPKILELTFKATVDYEPRERLVETVISSSEYKHSVAALVSTWKFAVITTEGVSLHLGALDVITESCKKREFEPFASSLVDMLLEAFGVRASKSHEVSTVNRIESLVISSALKIVLKLNDKTFRPLFARITRWAFAEDDYDKLITYFKFAVKVFSTLKRLVTDYYGRLVDPVCELLDKLNTKPNESLRRYVLQSLVASFQNDHDSFWQHDRLEHISKSLANQIPTIETNLGPILVKAFTTLAEVSSTSQENNEFINNLVCDHIKAHCSVNEKIWGIRVLKGLYSKLGEQWTALLPPLIPILAELLEDDEEVVENEVRRELVPVVEEALGESIDRYMS